MERSYFFNLSKLNKTCGCLLKVRLVIVFFLFAGSVHAQRKMLMSDQTDQHIFTYGEIQCLEDPTGTLQFSQISSGPDTSQFKDSWSSTPQNYDIGSVYWYRIKIRHPASTQKKWILEFFDQTIDDITAYLPTANGGYEHKHFGALNKFGDRTFHHKNFEVNLDIYPDKELTYYFRVRSHQRADIIIVLRSVGWFIQYALDEYFLFGVFYGMILVFAFYNLLMFLAVKQKQYLYYILYNLSVGFYELCNDGVGYEYLWPNAPGWNQYAYGVALCCVSVFALVFTDRLLFVKTNAPWLHKLIRVIIGIRTVFFFVCFFFDKQWFNYKFLEFIPLCIAFFTGIYVLIRGYRPARFFVLGYSFLLVGFIIKLLAAFGRIDFGTVGYYSLSICFILEMVFFAFALSDQVRVLKKSKDSAQRETIRQLKEKEIFKESINIRLEKQVQERTSEVIEKAKIIEQQNEDLYHANEILQLQAEEIMRMNQLLENNNRVLQTDFEKVSRDRIMSTEVDFEEFSRIYPDADSCYRLLAELKWKQGYQCHKCGNDHSFSGRTPYSRKCTKCSHEESVTAFTLLHNIRIPITKGFYLIFLVYSSSGKISSHKLAEILEIRQSTCWQYSNRIKKLLSGRPKRTKSENGDGWSKLLLEDVHAQ